MKKTISIHISGILFHIEEDGYLKLSQYLANISQYFSGYEGSREIVEDIESRIAEKFQTKVSDSRQVITLEDVNELIAAMGTIADFEASETEENPKSRQTVSVPTTSPSPKTLYRDETRKLLGGVASGIAYYLRIDPIWIRLLFLAGTPLYGIFAIIYLILWVAVPGNKNLEEDLTVKKFYRNPENKVLGGVTSGLAAYFGSDRNAVTLIRVLLVLTTFAFGTGLLFYLVLWAITPEAKTVTEKMQMQGQPLTLANIESAVKTSLNEHDSPQESVLTRILLFPFRVMAQVFKALSPVGNFSLVFARYSTGILLIFISVAILVSLALALGAIFRLFNPVVVSLGNVPPVTFSDTFPPALSVFAFLAVLIPFLFVGLAGAMLIFGKKLMNRQLSVSLLGIWLVSLVGAGIAGGIFATDFRTRSSVEQVQVFERNNSKIILKAREAGEERYRNTNLQLEGYNGNQIRLTKRFSAQGSNRDNARLNAQTITYQVSQQDSLLTFDSNFAFKPDAPFRGQDLALTLQMPYNQVFIADMSLNDLLHDFPFDLENEYKFTQKEGLVCLTCSTDTTQNHNLAVSYTHRELTDNEFDVLLVEGPFEIRLKQGERCSYRVIGGSEVEEQIEVEGNTLKIRFKSARFRNLNFDFKRPVVEVTMPFLSRVEMSGAAVLKSGFFSKLDEVKFDLSGASEAEMNADMQQADIDLSGASSLQLAGNVDDMQLEASGASSLKAFDLKTQTADAHVSGASHARLYVMQELAGEATGAAQIRYKGNPKKVNVDESGAGSVGRE
jgi:phage shock protein PspC (stress-responsive transcriptional regulator)